MKTYRNYKTFAETRFNDLVKPKLDLIDKLDYPLFESIFIDVLSTHAPVTTKTMRANSHQFMIEALRKAMMTRSRLKNLYLKIRNSKNSFKKQRNLLKKTKSEYFWNLNIRDLNCNKKFWKKLNLSVLRFRN